MRHVALVVGLASLTIIAALAVTEPAVAQQDAAASADSALFQQGEQLYADNCAVCHKPGGVGTPPTFPALVGNDNLQDLARIVSNIHLGKGSMVAFPDLTADEIAALATYVRNAWGNAYGEASSDEVATILGGLTEETGAQVSVWDGVYTEEQNARGKKVHSGACVRCHGFRLNGAGEPDMPPAPAIARAAFLRKWDGQTLAALYDYVRTKMPPDNPAMLGDQEYIDAVAHMLAMSNMPAGDTELPPDPSVLSGIVIEQKKP